MEEMTIVVSPIRRSVLGRAGRAALAAATMLAPLAALPALHGTAWAQNANPSGGQSGNGLEAAGRAAAAADAAPGGATPIQNAPPATEPGQPAVTRPLPPATPAAVSPGAAPAATPAVIANPAPQSAISVLLQQATFWHNQSQDGRAMEALQRALALDPNNAEALALTASIEVQQGNAAQANVALQKLRTVNPNDPHIAQIDRAIRIGQINPTQLAEARRLAQEGHNGEAVQRYQQIFRGNPPPDSLAVEYYQTLAATDGGWERARDGLAQIVRENPSDLRAQLAYAQLLTYREGARSEGIARLAQLAANPAVAGDATKAWRQALGWLPVQTSSVPPMEEFLARNPNDPTVTRLLEAAKNPPQGPPDVVGQSRMDAFKSLNGGQLAAAEKGFETALAANPNDPDALGGLGLVRLRQGRTAEGRTLLQRAIAADPARRARWQSALAGTEVGQEYASIRVMANRGDYAGAERQIRALMGRGGGNAGLQLMLADVQARRGDLAQAEATYRAVLAASPRSAPAMVGLAGVLQQENRMDEAVDLLTRAGATGNLKAIAQARAQQLRQQAALVSDPATKVGLYRAAIAADPENPWIRLDLARALVAQGQMGQARGLMDQLVNTRAPSTDALQAGIIFASENNLPDMTAALIARVPPGRRTAQMRATLAQAQLNRDIQATMMYPPEVARQRLMAMAAAAPDPDGTRGNAIARALTRLGYPGDARAAIATAQAMTRGGTPEQRVNYAGALMDAGDPNTAQRMLASLNGVPLTPQQRTAATSMHEGLVVRTSDALNQAGRRADAYDRLAPSLQQDPSSPSLNLALARLYQSNEDPKQALAINLAVLRRDPANTDARNAAVNAALAAGDRATADRLVAEGLQMNPNDPRAWITSADLAKARGNNVRAIRDLERARQLRLQQIGGSDAGADFGSTDPSSNPGIGVGAGTAGTGYGGATMTLAPYAPPIYSNTPPTTAAARPYPLNSGAPPLPSPYQPAYAGSGAPIYQPVQYVPSQSQYQASQNQPSQYQPSQYQPSPYQPSPYQPAPYPPARYAVPRAQPAQYAVPPAAQPLYAPPATVTAPAPVYGAPPAFAPPPPGYTPAPAYPTSTYPASADYTTTAAQFGSNPFRSGGSVSSSPFGSETNPVVAQDPLTAQIDQSIAALRAQIAPSMQGNVLFRGRSGTGGLDSLFEVATPMEATFSPGGYGQLRVLAQPTYLTAGTLGSTAFTQARLGTQALSIVGTGTTTPAPFGGREFGSQNAEGVGLDVGYKYGWFSADVGTTPLGFRFNNIIGGVELAPRLTDNLLLRVTGERRAVTDSLLSYAGQRDPRTGVDVGGVTRTRGYAQLELTEGLANFYAGGGYASLQGENVIVNQEGEAGAGGSYPVYRTATDELRVGADLVWFGFQKNLSNFTFGEGGYFSPQSYFAALIPVNWTSKAIENLTYSVGGSLGWQIFNEKSTPYFPGDPNLQATLNAISLTQPGLQTRYGGTSTNGITGIVHAAAEYAVTPNLKVGATGAFQHSGDYNEGQGLLYARYLFNGGE